MDAVNDIGARAVLSLKHRDLKATLRDATGRESENVVSDVIGAETWNELINVIERRGSYTFAGAIAGPIVEFDLRNFLPPRSDLYRVNRRAA